MLFFTGHSVTSSVHTSHVFFLHGVEALWGLDVALVDKEEKVLGLVHEWSDLIWSFESRFAIFGFRFLI